MNDKLCDSTIEKNYQVPLSGNCFIHIAVLKYDCHFTDNTIIWGQTASKYCIWILNPCLSKAKVLLLS